MVIPHSNASEKLTQKVEDVRSAISKILQDPDTPLKEVEDVITSLLEEASVSLEELYVAEEELIQQNEALQQSRFTLEEERQYYLDLFEAAPIGYIVTDAEGIIKEANQAASQLLNLHINYLISKPLIVFIPPDYRKEFRARLLEREAFHTAKTWETHVLPRHQTQVRDVAFTAVQAQVADDSQALRWLIHDITDRKRDEAIKLEHFFHETFEQAAVGIAHIDAEGHWLRVNPKLCAILGYSREELLRLKSQDVSHPDDVFLTTTVHQQLLRGEIDNTSIEKRYLHKNGEVIWVHYAISAVRDISSGGYVYGIAAINDITENKRIMAAEREQRELAEALRNTAMTLTSTLDFEEVLDHILGTVSRIVPQEAASILLIEDQNLHIVKGWGYEEKLIPKLEAVLKNVRLPDSEGSIFDLIKATKQPITLSGWLSNDEKPEIVNGVQSIHSLICTPIIVRDNVIGYLELHSSKPNFFTSAQIDQLQIFAAQAAIAIENARAHSQAIQLAAHEERQRLARDLHDAVTQTLFTSSIMSESLIRRARKNPNELIPYLEKIHLLNRGALAEMRTLLMELRPDHLLKIHLPTQLQQLVDAVRTRKAVEVEIKITESHSLPPELQLAFYRIAQEAFTNIVKHSQATKLEIDLNIQSDKTSLTIADNGYGFDPSVITAGMGLSIMRERAESIHASFQVSSELEQGTKISIVLLQSMEINMPQPTKIRILLVDDYEVLRDGIALCLEEFDDVELVAKASNGLAAVELCQELKPDVVLMDLIMPKMDGITATKLIHQEQPGLPVIALTSFEDNELIHAAKEVGIFEYLLKNISVDELVSAIRRAYAQKPALCSS